VSVVRPEFGPTLPELLGPRVRALPRAARVALAGAGATLVVLAIALIATRGGGITTTQIGGPVPFNLQWGKPLEQPRAHPGELLALHGPGGASYVIRPLRLPPYQGDTSAALMAAATRMEAAMTRTLPGFLLRQEGRARIANQPGYQIQYQFRDDGRTAYGRRVLLTPGQPGERLGVDIDLRVDRSPQVPTFDAAGTSGSLKLPLRTFHFGS
jgi:hypothetical protein